MRLDVDLGDVIELKLDRALLVYANQQRSRHMVTVHTVQHAENHLPVLGTGTLLSMETLRELAKQLGSGTLLECLPENVIARTPETLAWWTPAEVRPMFFGAGSELGGVSGKPFPHPPLLFVVAKGILHVRALCENRRPAATSRLAVAPYWNTGGDGKVCHGTMRAPNGVSSASIPQWETAFFQSEFTHPGDTVKLTRRKGGVVPLWQSLAGARRFPRRTLIAAEGLIDYLKGLESK
jgi:PRTRC genetic system protein B